MPREFRKRGKKTKKSSDKDQWRPSKNEQVPQGYQGEPEDEPHAGPSWIIPVSKNSEQINPEAPFGFLDADVKAYFRTVDIQIRSWQDNGTEAREGDTDVDPNEGTSSFFGPFSVLFI
jgi:nucleolar protein 9